MSLLQMDIVKQYLPFMSHRHPKVLTKVQNFFVAKRMKYMFDGLGAPRVAGNTFFCYL
jgi:hypothetical protein